MTGSKPARPRLSTRKKLLFLAVLVTSHVAFGEIAIRVSWLFSGKSKSDYILSYMYEGHPYAAYKLKGNLDAAYKTNSLGLRGPEVAPKKENEFRVICIGGSTTFGTGATSDEATYPAQLEKILAEKLAPRPVTVINAGVPSYTTAEMMIMFELKLIDLKPDLVVLYLGANDVVPRLYPGYAGDYSHYRKGFIPPRTKGIARIFERSAVYLYLRWRFTRYSETTIVELIERENEAKKEERLVALEANSTAAFERNLRSMIAVCRARGIVVLLSTFASNIGEEAKEHFFGRAFEKGIADNNRVIRKLGASEDIVFFDLVEELGDRPGLFVEGDLVHFSDVGSRVQAEMYADVIESLEIE
jgi:lysophospholipase L1-like esterase